MIQKRKQRLIFFALFPLVTGLKSVQAAKIIIKILEGGEFDQKNVDLAKTTVRQLKEIVEKKTGVPPELQRICFFKKGLHNGMRLLQKDLNDGKTLLQENMYNRAEVYVIFKPMKIFVQLEGGKKIKLKVRFQGTIEEVKQIIVNKMIMIQQYNYSFPAINELTLYFNDTKLDSGKTLKSYGIKKNNTLRIKSKSDQQESITINIRDITSTPPKNFSLTVNLSATVEDVKKMIQMKKGNPVDEQILSYHDIKKSTVILTNNEKTLNDYRVNKNVLLLLKVKKEETDGKEKNKNNQGLSLWWAALPIALIVVCVAIYALSQKAKKGGILPKKREALEK